MKNQITEAPQWLIDRMEKLKKMKRRSSKEVEKQFRASEEARKKYDK